jgi:hypothetical protein
MRLGRRDWSIALNMRGITKLQMHSEFVAAVNQNIDIQALPARYPGQGLSPLQSNLVGQRLALASILVNDPPKIFVLNDCDFAGEHGIASPGRNARYGRY